MEQREFARITTFVEAVGALQEFDRVYWRHPPWMPTIRHGMHHMCRSMDNAVGSGELALVFFEHALRLARQCDVVLDLASWLPETRIGLRMQYVADEKNGFRGVGAQYHLNLNEIVLAWEDELMADDQAILSVAPMVDGLFRAACVALGSSLRRAPEAEDVWRAVEQRITTLYAKHDIAAVFAEGFAPASH